METEVPKTIPSPQTDIQQNHQNKTIKSVLWHVMLMLIFALCCESFIFNSGYWLFDAQTYHKQEFVLPLNEQLQRNAVILDKQNNVLNLSQLNTMIAAIELEVYGGSPMVKGEIQVTSEHQVYIPQIISRFCVASGLNNDLRSVAQDYQHTIIKFDLLEKVLSLIVSFDKDTLSAPIAVTKIIINPPPKFKFSFTRLVLMMLGLGLSYLLFCSQSYRRCMIVDSRLYKWLNRSILVAIILCSTALFAVYHPSVVTETGFKYISLGFLPHGTPHGTALQEIPTTQEGLANVDPYIELADALLVKHQLNVDLWIDPGLTKLDNMYDASERAYKNIKFHLDRAFYNGKYYVYFGLAPIVLIYAPIYLITGLVPGAACAIFIAVLYAILGLHLLSSRLTTLLCHECNIVLFVITKISLYVCSLVFFLQAELLFYRLPYLTSMAALCLAMYCALGLLLGSNKSIKPANEEHIAEQPILPKPVSTQEIGSDANGSWKAEDALKPNKLVQVYQYCKNNWFSATKEDIPFTWDLKQMGAMVVCGVCVVLVVMSRPLSLLYLIVGVGICYVLYLFNGEQAKANKIINSLCLVIPVLLGAVIVCAYNYARFDSIFEFGQYRQVTGEDNLANYTHLNLASFKTLLFGVFFRNFEFMSAFPYIGLNGHQETQFGQFVPLGKHAGLLLIPYYWGLALLPLLWKLKHLSPQCTKPLLPPLQSNWRLHAIQSIITSWYVLIPFILLLMVYSAGWHQRYLSEFTALACLFPFIFIMLLKFTWQSDAERVFYLFWIMCCLISCCMLFFLTINNGRCDLEFVNPRAYLMLKEIFDPLGFN